MGTAYCKSSEIGIEIETEIEKLEMGSGKLEVCSKKKMEWVYFSFLYNEISMMILLVSKYFLRKNFKGITLWPFVICCDVKLKDDVRFINHEKIHLRQQIEMLVLPFYVWYLGEYLFRLIQYKNKHLAYRNISFEREAYANENDFQYLKRRPFWRFLKYL